MKKIYNLPLAVCVLSFLSFAVCHAAQLPEYEINANIDTAAHTIKAHQTVTYTNNSDSQLQEIYFHIYPNRRYTKSEIRFIYRYAGYFKIDPFPEGFQSGSLSLDSVASGGDSLKFVIEGEDQTILKVILNSALKPGDSVKIDMDFKVKVPHAYGRFGWHKDIMSLVRWYPILSVFDKQGWHNYPFYIYHLPHFSEASSYKLKLTLPADQKVASSGFLKGEVINPDGTKTMEIETDFPVRDFSLGISNSFEVYSLASGKTRVNAYYLKGDADKARAAAEDARDLMEFYGARFGEYPYRDFNIVPSFLGYGGVQSSAQVFIDTRVYKLPGFLHRYFDFLVSHETGHQWFYNLIGCDEYKEMFLDEGVNSYWILQYLESKYGKGAQVMDLPRPLQWLVPNFSFRDSAIARYLYIAKNDLDAPVIRELSSFQEPSSIFAITYGKGQAILDMLEALIGQEDFLKIWQSYAEEFRFKNISLEEFIQTCSKGSGRDLSWFFDEWLKTRESCDYAIKSVTPDAVTLENRGK
ncbi:MAG: M1 family metallopeptidase, partial [Deltaproteobacteria bacterium]